MWLVQLGLVIFPGFVKRFLQILRGERCHMINSVQSGVSTVVEKNYPNDI